jgi:hypothetical protein
MTSSSPLEVPMNRNKKLSLQGDGPAQPIVTDDLPDDRALETDLSGPLHPREVPTSSSNSTCDEYHFIDEDIYS